MLQIQGISKQYKTGDFVQRALDNVSLNLRDSEFVAILGPSGSGKTTLLNIIGGLDHYDSGDLVINGISTVTPSALTSVPSGSCENTENLVSYEYWIPAEPIYRLMSLSLLSRYFLNALRLFSVMLLVIEAVPLMAASSG